MIIFLIIIRFNLHIMGNIVKTIRFRYTELTNEDIEYIRANTSLTTSEIEQLHQEFLVKKFLSQLFMK